VASPSAPSAPGAAAAPAARELRVGDPAPDFTLPDQHRQNVALSQYRGRPVQIAFYVYAFSGG
jgi:peroxiredoxin